MGFLGKLFTIDVGGEDRPKKSLFSKLFHSNRIGFIKKLSKDLEIEVAELREHVLDFNRKVSLLRKFVETKDERHLKELRKIIKGIQKIVYRETSHDNREGKLALKIERSIRHALSKEKVRDFFNDETEIRQELIELRIDVEDLMPILESQLKFLSLPLNEQKKRIKELYSDIHKEAEIIGYEKKYLSELKDSIEKYEVDAVVSD